MSNTQDTYTLARAFYKTENAAKHFESLLPSLDPRTKARKDFDGYVKKLRWVLNDVMTNLKPESREIFKAELHTWETLAFDSVESEMILMTLEQRLVFEQVAVAFRKGEMQLEEGPNYKAMYEQEKEQAEKWRGKYHRLKKAKAAADVSY